MDTLITLAAWAAIAVLGLGILTVALLPVYLLVWGRGDE